MKLSLRSFAFLSITLVAASGLAYGQQPPDIVQSDNAGNTAMGNGALINLAISPPPGIGGRENTAVGKGTLVENTSGSENTAIGDYALEFNTTGSYNTANGKEALFTNATGKFNTATGWDAIYNNISGSNNSGFGVASLYHNTTGTSNTAIGFSTLGSNTVGSYNTSSGYESLYTNTTGNNNTASGWSALYSNTNGNSNTADGHHSLYANTTGYHNTASGADALESNLSGNSNTAVGLESLYYNKTGSNNIALGTSAGYNLTTGSNNIDIGNQGAARESGTVRIGAAGSQTATYIAGISTAHVTGAAVYVTSSGQLGVLASSERYKIAITPMGSTTEKLQQLRPVTFHLKTEPIGSVQYGLIAEEVAKIYPELVIRDDAGKIQGVRYDELAPMLLNEVQQQKARLAQQSNQLQDMRQQLAELKRANDSTHATLAKLVGKDERVALR